MKNLTIATDRHYWLSIIWMLFSIVLVLALQGSSVVIHNFFTYVTTATYIFCLWNLWKTGNRIISLFSFFIVYSFFCNCSQQLLYSFSVPDDFLTAYNYVDIQSVIKMMKYQFLCISALNLGAMLYIKNKKNSISIQKQIQWYNSLNNISDRYEYLVLILYYICLLGTIYAAFRVAQVRSSMSYHDYMFSGYKDIDMMFYFSYFFAFLSLRSVFEKKRVFITYLSWALLIVVYMALGLRTQAIPYVGFFIITLCVTNPGLFKRKFLPLWIVSGLASFIMLGLISSTRDEVGTNLTSGSQGAVIDILTTVADVGSSSQTIALTIDAVDKGTPHYQTILYFMFTTIPQTVLKVPIEYIDAIWKPEWGSSLGGFISRYAGSTHSGLGYSYIAESYLNYDWLGFIFIIILGYIFIAMENSAYRSIMKGNYFPITYLLLLGKSVFYARGEIILCNIYVEYLIFTFILFKLFRIRTSDKRS